MSFDMGGTTAKLCMLLGGQPRIAPELEVAHAAKFRRGSGLPLKIQSVQMIEIGSGGGSIAHVGALGLLAVGPRSAAASPGPACYGLGGTEPTVTDVDLVLGYLDRGFVSRRHVQAASRRRADGGRRAGGRTWIDPGALCLRRPRPGQRSDGPRRGDARDGWRHRPEPPVDDRLRRRRSGARVWRGAQDRHQARHLPAWAPG